MEQIYPTLRCNHPSFQRYEVDGTASSELHLKYRVPNVVVALYMGSHWVSCRTKEGVTSTVSTSDRS